MVVRPTTSIAQASVCIQVGVEVRKVVELELVAQAPMVPATGLQLGRWNFVPRDLEYIPFELVYGQQLYLCV